MSTVKATKISNCEVSISLAEAAEIVRHELNSHGSRGAGMNIAIPPKATFHIERNTISEDRTDDVLIFSWQE